jgi:ribosomal protein L29
MASPARPVLTPEMQKKLIDSVRAEVGSRSIEELETERDELLISLVELRNKRAEIAASHKAAAE